MRTNNSLEGIHNRINKFFDTNNPTIWNFIDKLRSFDESIYSDVLQWNNGLEPSARKKWYCGESKGRCAWSLWSNRQYGLLTIRGESISLVVRIVLLLTVFYLFIVSHVIYCLLVINCNKICF